MQAEETGLEIRWSVTSPWALIRVSQPWFFRCGSLCGNHLLGESAGLWGAHEASCVRTHPSGA